ncbi:MAG: hypothetical protein ACRD5Z_13015 [Bryobacteraceae bacterium]
MSFEQVAAVAQIAGSIGVVLSLVFVGLQMKQNTAALYRGEHNSTMSQWTVIRMAIAQHRDIAELMTTGRAGKSELDRPDQLRLELFLNEQRASELPYLGPGAARSLPERYSRSVRGRLPQILAPYFARQRVVAGRPECAVLSAVAVLH